MSAVATYLQRVSDVTTQTTYTFTSQNLGTASSDRYIIVSVVSRKSGTGGAISSVTVGGVSAAIVAQVTNPGGSNSNVSGLAIALVPTGTSGTVVVTLNAAHLRCSVALWSVTGISSATAFDTDSSTANDPAVSIDVPAGGLVFGGSISAISDTATWTGLTEDFDNNFQTNATHAGGHAQYATAQSGLAVTCDWATGSVSAGVFASWAPATTGTGISLVSSTAAAGSSGSATTSPINTTGASLIIVSLGSYSAENVVSDSNSNVWTKLTTQTASVNARNTLYYCQNPIVGTAHTFTNSGGTNYPAIAVAAFSGVSLAAPFDVQNGAGTSALSTSLQAGAITPSANNELIVTGLCFDTAGTISINGFFTLLGQQNYSSGVNMGVALAYRVQSGATTDNPTWTSTSSQNAAATIASFKESSISGGNVKIWNGSAWVPKPIKVWNGSSWVTKPAKRWNGSAWVVTPY